MIHISWEMLNFRNFRNHFSTEYSNTLFKSKLNFIFTLRNVRHSSDNWML